MCPVSKGGEEGGGVDVALWAVSRMEEVAVRGAQRIHEEAAAPGRARAREHGTGRRGREGARAASGRAAPSTRGGGGGEGKGQGGGGRASRLCGMSARRSEYPPIASGGDAICLQWRARSAEAGAAARRRAGTLGPEAGPGYLALRGRGRGWEWLQRHSSGRGPGRRGGGRGRAPPWCRDTRPL